MSTFTVTATRFDGTTDTEYSGSMAVYKTSGPGTMGGTVNVTPASGVGTFSNVTFSAAGTYAVSASAGP